MTDLSIIIVSYRGWARLEKCLNALNSFNGESFKTEVIIVDNRSGDNRLDSFKESFSKFHFIDNSVNGGFANGCNLGANQSSGEFLLFLNPDTVASEAEVGKLLISARGIDGSAVVSCKQINENGKESIAFGEFPDFNNLTGFQRAVFRKKTEEVAKKDDENGEILFPDWISGSVVLMKRDYFQKLKGFDEDFWMYYEDVDLCKRAHNSGGRIVFYRNIVIEHNHGGSSRINIRTTSITKTEVHISRHIYIQKHKTGLSGIMIQLFLVINNLISTGLIGLIGLIGFFIPKLFVRTLVFLRLTGYYLNSLFRLSWISQRSVNYTVVKKLD